MRHSAVPRRAIWTFSARGGKSRLRSSAPVPPRSGAGRVQSTTGRPQAAVRVTADPARPGGTSEKDRPVAATHEHAEPEPTRRTSSTSQPAPSPPSAPPPRSGRSSTRSTPTPRRWPLAPRRGRPRARSRSGQEITIIWRGKPVFIRHRTPGGDQGGAATSTSRALQRPADRRGARQAGQARMAGRGRHLHPSGLRAARLRRASTAAGSARATARSTTPPGASARARRRPT